MWTKRGERIINLACIQHKHVHLGLYIQKYLQASQNEIYILEIEKNKWRRVVVKSQAETNRRFFSYFKLLLFETDT